MISIEVQDELLVLNQKKRKPTCLERYRRLDVGQFIFMLGCLTMLIFILALLIKNYETFST